MNRAPEVFLTLDRRAALFGAATGPLLAGARDSMETLGRQNVAQTITAKTGGIGAQVCIMSGEKITPFCFGQSNVELGAPISLHSPFRIASLSKQFTAVAILRLMESGRLDLDNPISKHLKGIEDAEQITIRGLLSHTSGLEDAVLWREGAAEVGYCLGAPQSLEPFVDGERSKVAHPPGAFVYSNAGYALLARVIESLSGMSYSEFVAREVIGRAGMGSTFCETASMIVQGRVSGYSRGEDGRLQNAVPLNISEFEGAASIQSTASDLCRFHSALLLGSILTRRSLDLMLSPSEPPVHSPENESGSSTTRYALGIGVGEISGRRIVAHEGVIPGFYALQLTFMDPFRSVAVLANYDGGSQSNAFKETMQDLTRRLLYDMPLTSD